MMITMFKDRVEAGILLSKKLKNLGETNELLVLALPRGGVPIAAQISQSLNAPLGLLIVRKLGHPLDPEYAIGAIDQDKHIYMNANAPVISDEEMKMIIEKEYAELLRRQEYYLKGRPPTHFSGKTIIVVDDGIATGASLKVALKYLKRKEPKRIVVAVPVAPKEMLLELKTYCDEVVCLIKAENFQSVGYWYEQFEQVSDAEVSQFLNPKKNS